MSRGSELVFDSGSPSTTPLSTYFGGPWLYRLCARSVGLGMPVTGVQLTVRTDWEE